MRALTLLGISGSRVGQAAVVEAHSTIVGAAGNCDMVLYDRLVLPHHAEIRVALDRWFILSLDPTATLFVNGQPVTGQQRLEPGDLITVGTVTFKAAIGSVAERQVGGVARW